MYERTTALKLAPRLMDTHGLKNWTVELNKSVHKFGRCGHRTRRIILSAPLVELNTPDEVRDTILHEIAHALTPNHRGHSARWKPELAAALLEWVATLPRPAEPYVR